MEVQIKKTVKAGNSSAVILPRAWLNREVRVELVKKTPEIILPDVIGILNKHIILNEVIGIYLVGSYARGDEDRNSDVDILVITHDVDKEIIKEGIYNILIVSSKLLKQKLYQDLFPIGQMIKEAKPLLNADYLSQLKVNVTNKNIKWYLDTTEDKLAIIKQVIDKIRKNNGKYLDDKVAYTLILRIRTLYIIQKLIKNQDYSKKEFIKLIETISKGNNAYERYLAVKNNLEEKKVIGIEETEGLSNYLEKQLAELNGLLKKRNR